MIVAKLVRLRETARRGLPIGTRHLSHFQLLPDLDTGSHSVTDRSRRKAGQELVSDPIENLLDRRGWGDAKDFIDNLTQFDGAA